MNRLNAYAFLICTGVYGSNVFAQNPKFDLATSVLTLPALEANGTTYTNLVVRLNDFSVVSAGGSFPTTHVAIPTTLSGGLTWTDVSTNAYSWPQANEYCSFTSFNGLGGWRLPSRPETSNSPSNADIWTNQPYVESATPKESKHYVTSTIKTSSGAGSQTIKIFADYQPNYVVCVR